MTEDQLKKKQQRDNKRKQMAQEKREKDKVHIEPFRQKICAVREKTNNLGSDEVQHKTGLCSHRRWLEAGHFGFR